MDEKMQQSLLDEGKEHIQSLTELYGPVEDWKEVVTTLIETTIAENSERVSFAFETADEGEHSNFKTFTTKKSLMRNHVRSALIRHMQEVAETYPRIDRGESDF